MIRVAACAVGLALALGSTARAQVPLPPEIQVQGYWMAPNPFSPMMSLREPSVVEELKLTESQRRALSPEAHRERMMEKLQPIRKIEDQAKRQEAIQGVRQEVERAMLESLEPAQSERLGQIRLQVEGPMAFLFADLPERLGLTPDQVGKIRTVVEAGRAEQAKVATVPLPADLKLEDTAGGLRSIRDRVEGPEFQAALEEARRGSREAREATLGRVLGVLTDRQREQYAGMLGPRFDVGRIASPTQETEMAVLMLARRSGMVGQRADPDFPTRVERPAYTEAHPRVLFDEAHHNFHTAGGRYKPFADLIGGDGYKVIPNREKFTREVLEKGDILVIANALGAEGMGSPDASKPAFTEAEIEAVRKWVHDGGSLLLISDHPPMGSAAAGLSARFGVVMSQGVALDPRNSGDGPSQLVFSRENRLLGDHPITRGRNESERLGKIMTFTGQSLRGGAGSVSFLTLGESATDDADGKEASAAGASQGLALPFGQGRVVVLGEAGQLSAQILGPMRSPMGMNFPGIDNRQFALNIMHWLSGLLEPR